MGPDVIAGPVFWAAEDAAEVLRFYRDIVADAPDELGNIVRLGTVPAASDSEGSALATSHRRGFVLRRCHRGG